MRVEQSTTTLRTTATRLGTFAAVGLSATCVHAATALAIAQITSAYVANAIAFAIASIVTYAGNYRFTFRSSGAHVETTIRFAVVSGATLAVSEWALLLMELSGAREWVAMVVAVGAIPLLRFGLMAKHVFDPDRWRGRSEDGHVSRRLAWAALGAPRSTRPAPEADRSQPAL